jgi:Predicted AAA-ATPase
MFFRTFASATDSFMENKLKKLPIGIQFFNSMQEDDYAYVDKTEPMYRMINTAKFIFLSRPRRFGKSLLASTLEHLFLANRHYFKDLWIDEHWEWQARPVIRLDMGSLDYKTQSLEKALKTTYCNGRRISMLK